MLSSIWRTAVRPPRTAETSRLPGRARRGFSMAVAGFALSASLLTQPAWAAPWEQHVAPNNLAPTQGRSISVERAVRIARQETGGRVLAATPSRRGSRSGVEVRILKDGGSRVSTIFVEADGSIRRR